MKKILFINSEIIPYVPETEPAMMGKLVPHRMQENGCEIRTFMPKWGEINERRGQLHEVIRLSGLNIVIDDQDHPTLIKVASIPQTKIQVYFIDNDDFFTKRGMIGDGDGNIYNDNGERAIFFARAVIETIKKLRWTPDIIHCQGWMASLVPFYLKKAYFDEPCVCNAKVITSVFGSDVNIPINDKAMKQNIAYRDITVESLADYSDQFSATEMLKMAIDYSDGIIEATPDINPEIAERIKASKAELLSYPGEDFADAYAKFYDNIFPEE